MKNKKTIIFLLIIFLAFTVFLLYRNIPSIVNGKDFPPKNVECFNHFIDIVDTGYADGFRIPPFRFEDISYFRCASELGFNQYEINGKDKEGNTFYIHKDEGGMAPSGSDGIYNLCYKKNGLIIKSEKLIGRESIKEEGVCDWTLGFPQNPSSIYMYDSK